MTKYRCTFVGRRSGAIGITYPTAAIVEATDVEAARLALTEAGWEVFEDLRIVPVAPAPVPGENRHE